IHPCGSDVIVPRLGCGRTNSKLGKFAGVAAAIQCADLVLVDVPSCSRAGFSLSRLSLGLDNAAEQNRGGARLSLAKNVQILGQLAVAAALVCTNFSASV